MPLEVLVRAVGEAWAEAWPAVFWVRPHFLPFRPPCAAYELRGPTKPSHKSKTQAEKAKFGAQKGGHGRGEGAGPGAGFVKGRVASAVGGASVRCLLVQQLQKTTVSAVGTTTLYGQLQ